jgi:hypothetical protein
MNQLCEFYTKPEHERTRPFDRVLFVRIQPFPISKPKPAEVGKGWKFATTGPLHGMLNVRQASQAERGNLEADLLAATRHLQNEARHLHRQNEHAQELAHRYAPKAESKKLDAAMAEHQAQMPLPSMNKLPFPTAESPSGTRMRGLNARSASGKPLEGIHVDSVTITFPLPDTDDVLPLSWKLSEFDKLRIDNAWKKVLGNARSDGSPLVKLDSFFGNGRLAERATTARKPHSPSPNDRGSETVLRQPEARRR